MASAITPLGDRIVAVREEAKEKTDSGFYLPDTSKEAPVLAKIVAVGPKASLSTGDRIIYKEYATTTVTYEGTEYLIIKEEDILATV